MSKMFLARYLTGYPTRPDIEPDIKYGYWIPGQLPDTWQVTGYPACYRIPGQFPDTQPVIGYPASYRIPGQLPDTRPVSGYPASYRIPGRLLDIRPLLYPFHPLYECNNACRLEMTNRRYLYFPSKH